MKIRTALEAVFLFDNNESPGWYNFHVPTPFHHMHLAEQVINHPKMPNEITNFLQRWRCVFMFGSTAPDVQVVSGQARQVTHFFNIPVQVDDPPAWELILCAYPQLSEVKLLSEQQSAFVAGYLCHLQADWLWVKDIFTPIFGPRCAWGTFQQRLYYHNVLRTYLDLRILPELTSGMDGCLSMVTPDGWLPFVDDRHLRQWRDLISRQLEPDGTPQTVEVFSSRQGISAPEYYALIESEERMQAEVFVHIPYQQVETYQQRTLKENTRLLCNYLAFSLH